MQEILYFASLAVLLTGAESAQQKCIPILELANQANWITWCNTNCGNPPGTHPACTGEGVHAKCTCGPTHGNFLIDIDFIYFLTMKF